MTVSTQYLLLKDKIRQRKFEGPMGFVTLFMNGAAPPPTPQHLRGAPGVVPKEGFIGRG